MITRLFSNNTKVGGKLTEKPQPITLQISSNRNASLDALRTLLIFFVVAIHVVSPYVQYALDNLVFDLTFWISNLVDSFSRVCVPIFVLISGAFLLGKGESYSQFYKKRFPRIIWPLIAWTIIYSIYTLIQNYFYKGTLDIIPIAKSIITGAPFYHLWYLYMLLGLYLVTPIINRALQGVRFEHVKLTAYALLICGILLNIWNTFFGNVQFSLLWFTEYLGYFLLGYVLTKSHEKDNSFSLFSLYIIASILTAILVYTFRSTYFYSLLSPLVAISSISLFKIFTQSKVSNSPFSRFSQYTFGIYLSHALILAIVHLVEKNQELSTSIPLLDILIKFWIVLIISSLIVKVLLCAPRFNKIV